LNVKGISNNNISIIDGDGNRRVLESIIRLLKLGQIEEKGEKHNAR
jgi:hypothetical protein